MEATAYEKWDREAAAARALQHADASGARDAGGGIWNFAFGSNMSASKVIPPQPHTGTLAHCSITIASPYHTSKAPSHAPLLHFLCRRRSAAAASRPCGHSSLTCLAGTCGGYSRSYSRSVFV